MSFSGIEVTVLGYLFSFRGRVNRAKAWAFYLVAFAAELSVIASIFTLRAVSGETAALFSGQDIVEVTCDVFAIATLAALEWAYIAVVVKRLHDRDRSGWWFLIFYVLPMLPVLAAIGIVAASGLTPEALLSKFSIMSAFGVAGAFQLWAFVEIYILAGTPGPNRFGPDPLGRTE